MGKFGQRDSSRVTLLTAEPTVFVSDMDRALAFYYDKLGFGVRLTHGEPVFFASLIRNGVRLNLRLSSRRPYDPAFLASEPDVLAATIAVSNVEDLADEYAAHSVDFHRALGPTEWGVLGFVVADPDDNLIYFAG